MVESTSGETLPGLPGAHFASAGTRAGDRPNPDLSGFVARHARALVPEHDDYSVIAFDRPIVASKATALYNMHSYHQGKKPHDAIRQYVRHYTKPGDLVLDPFSGSGATALAAILEDRKAIAVDRSPAATFLTACHCTPIDPSALQAAFATIESKVRAEIDWLYETCCDRCGGRATTGYCVYSQVFRCPRCSQSVPRFDCVETEGRTASGKARRLMACPACFERGCVEEIRTRGERLGAIPVLVSYLCRDGCSPARDERRHNDPVARKRRAFERFDLGKLREIESLPIPHWYPPHKMMNVEDDSRPWGAEWRRGRNVRTVSELFTKRNLWAIAALREAAASLDADFASLGMLALTGTMLHLSRMSHHKPGGGGIMVGTYYLPQLSKERNALESYLAKSREIAAALGSVTLPPRTVCISTQSACRLDAIPSSSIDYIFTDPPYADNVQYGELNFVWEAWLGFDTRWHREEIIVNDVRGLSAADWAGRMRLAIAECYRVLKPGRWLSLCYHDAPGGTWPLLQDLMTSVGFIVDKTGSALTIDTWQKSYNQITTDKATKRDLVLNFRKPGTGEPLAARQVDEGTFAEVGSDVIREFLVRHPGATKDRIYDELVSRMFRAGRLEAHDFDALLRSVAEEVRESPGRRSRRSTTSRWFVIGESSTRTSDSHVLPSG